MGDPGLFQAFAELPPQVPEGGGNREQPAAADGAIGRLDAMADHALSHRLAQGSLGGIGGGFDPLDLQEDPQSITALQQLIACAHRCCLGEVDEGGEAFARHNAANGIAQPLLRRRGGATAQPLQKLLPGGLPRHGALPLAAGGSYPPRSKEPTSC